MGVDTSFDLAKLHASVVHWVTEDTHQGCFVTDVQLRVVLWNRWMELHSGRSASEVLGRSLLDLYPDVGDREIKEYYQSAVEGRVTILAHALHRYIIALPPTNSDLGFAHMPQSGRIGPLDDAGVLVGTVTIVEDVSDRLASESVLRRQIEAQQLARGMAENALRAKDEFLSTLSHEIRTPLNAVLGWARILISRGEIDRTLLDRAVHVIERNATAQARMIDDMLDMARIAAGKLRLEMRPVDVVKVVLAAVDVVMPAAHAKRVALRTNLDPRTPNVMGDQDRLQQVIWNLLSNALKFTEAGGSIDVRLSLNGRFTRIVVADTGHGISPEFLPHVFERFRQADASSSRRHGGLGVGLALVHDLIVLHGGSVLAQSEGDGKGAMFTIDLPTVAAQEIDASIEGNGLQSRAMTSLDRVRVLLIDDDTDARELSQAVLEQCGARVKAVSSSAEAIASLLDTPRALMPHVIVSDLGMPAQDGYQLIRQIRAIDSELGRIPAVAVTGYATADDVQRALTAGFQLHISKPMDPAAFVAAVADLARVDRA
ncbi:MAG TPA: ATP-binding protein [Vicinamibacterales bacterium]|nr:ATP-binding protein [Vicinamibacterales bacterium]